MIYERKVVDKEKGIVQITTESERWYSREKAGKIIYAPSVTWICEYFPKGIGFYKWLADKGWDEAEALKAAAGDKGSKIHQAVDTLMEGHTIKFDSTFKNNKTEEFEALSAQEYEAVMSFKTWFDAVKPKVVKKDFNVFMADDTFAGTVDLVCVLKDPKTGLEEEWVIDFKTGQSIWPSYELQVSAYAQAIGGSFRLGILQLGYWRNDKKYKFTEVENKFDLFMATRQIWANECAKIVPLQKDYPLEIRIDVPTQKEEA